MVSEDSFFERLPPEQDFERLTENDRYHALPDDWYLGVADIVASTEHVAAGRYKTVNMVAAAVISAVMNSDRGRPFPFVFGGDGAGFAISPDRRENAAAALAAVARWAATEFGIEIRVALVPVVAVRAAGKEALIARFRASEGADYAMFGGGGLLWAEAQMKKGKYTIAKAAPGMSPDLTGLSCRWGHMRAQSGTIVSLVVSAQTGAAQEDVMHVYKEVIAIAQKLERGGHPAPRAGMSATWPPAGATLEARAAKGAGSLLQAHQKVLFESFLAWLLVKTGWSIGGFNARRYTKVVAANADFRKLDDGLKMTLDCDAATQARLIDVLEKATEDRVIRYGIATQDEAMMTCIVPSIMTDDHLHFIDGASGGYTKAASMMKGR